MGERDKMYGLNVAYIPAMTPILLKGAIK